MLPKVKMEKKSKKIFGERRKKELLFYILLVAYPVVQFCIFYVYVNFNSILLSLKSYDLDEGYFFVGLKNFRDVFNLLSNDVPFQTYVKNSLFVLLLGLGIGSFLPLLVSYYVFKKKLLSGVFRIILFIPAVISSLALVLGYKFFLEQAVPDIYFQLTGKVIDGLITNMNTRYFFILLYSYLFGYGTTFLLYVSTMSGISDSVLEAVKLEGANSIQEFVHIIMPLIYPTFTTFFVVSVGAMFQNQNHLFNFYGVDAPHALRTIGYHLYRNAAVGAADTLPQLSAMGLLFTFISLPITLLVKYLMERFGPSVD